MKHKTPAIFAREVAVAGIIRVFTVVMSLYFELLAIACKAGIERGRGEGGKRGGSGKEGKGRLL